MLRYLLLVMIFSLFSFGNIPPNTYSLQQTTNYSYDDLGRLTDESITDSTNGNYTASYTYDAVSNRIQSIIDGVTTQYTYEDNDRLTQQGGTTYTYDDNGNTLTETLDTNTTSYTYNSKNQLIKSINPTQTITYTYDSKGIRTSKTVNNKTTQYLVDSNQPYAQVLQELENNTLTVSYTYGSDLISQNRNNQTTTYHYDGLGSARYLSDSSGTFTDSYNYEAFGKLLQQEGNTTNHYKYTGEQQDEESKQYYLRARYYAPTTGRFTQQDTYMGNSSDPISLHKYLYASANPQTYTDPSGYFSIAGMAMASNIQSSLQNMQIGAYSNFGDVVTGGWDGVDLNSIPAIDGTAVGLRLMMRFSPKLQKACKNSFDGQTLVATENGLVPIEDIRIGDKVWAYNEHNQSKSLQEVTHLIRGEGNKTLTDITLNSGEIITATSNHPFWEVADNNWTKAGKLSLDNILLDIHGNNTSIVNLRSYSQNAVVYNLTVANDHTYFVGSGGVLGHNADCPWIINWKGFSKGKLREHYDKHVIRQKEFGNISQSKYLKLAKEFSQEKNDRFQDKIVKNTLIRFDPQTGRVFVGHLKKKEIRTFYIDDGKGNNPFETAMYKVGI